VVLRTRPLPALSQWHRAPATDPHVVFTRLHRPTSVLWDGATVWVLLEGHPADVAAQAATAGLSACDGPPVLPSGSRRSIAPATIPSFSGTFVAEVGVGIVHHAEPWSPPPRADRVIALARAVKAEFDPDGRLNPGVDV
jgi:glycolate oxidase FAD binding subunit